MDLTQREKKPSSMELKPQPGQKKRQRRAEKMYVGVHMAKKKREGE